MTREARLAAVARATLGPQADKQSIKAEIERLRNTFDDKSLENYARLKAINSPQLQKLIEPSKPIEPKDRKPLFQRMAEAREQKALELANPKLKTARKELEVAAAKARTLDLQQRGVLPSPPKQQDVPDTDALKDRVEKQREVAALTLEGERFRAEQYNKMNQLAAQRSAVFSGLGGSTGTFSSGVASRIFGGGVSDLTAMADAMAEVADNTGDIARDIAAIRDSGGLE